ncbi:uncharacterized protein DNG_08797 [Cephalotrichum gorgonifer]|uniref:Gamma-butyrobetaine dioxygenase n=1 Tax=Cephalotrichum gorgonifer TaxID=2041049 RepID=A0AAE8N694_9PEZI|nr:uncharacterized protein DNG_08797 [Cephalotrichum gorgonifer]
MLPRLLARSSRPALRTARRAIPVSTPIIPTCPRSQFTPRLLTTSWHLRNPAVDTAAATAPADAHLAPAPAWLHEKVSTAALWLRDSCRCEICVSPSSGQKSFATTDIPASIQPKTVRVSPSGELAVEWANDIPGAAAQGHASTYSPAYLDSLHFRKVLGEREPSDFTLSDRTIPYRAWNAETLRRHLGGGAEKLEHRDFMSSDDAYWRALFDLEAYGIVFLKNVPRDEGSVAEVGLRIANLQETFYGRTWDVVSKPDAENVAYTNSYLGLHEDMMYLVQPPRIQLLHCMDNSCDGGESIFSDASAAVLEMMNDPLEREGVELLSEYLVRYHYDKHPFSYRQARPVFNVRTDEEGRRELVNVWWSPPFQAPNPPYVSDAGHARHRAWQAAAARFEGILSRGDNVYEVKLEPGECVIFDNRRVLHGRKAFNTGSGERWLRGTYISDEDFTSRMRSADREAVAAYRREKGLEGGEGRKGSDERMAGYGSLGGWLRSPGELPGEALEGKLWRA